MQFLVSSSSSTISTAGPSIPGICDRGWLLATESYRPGGRRLSWGLKVGLETDPRGFDSDPGDASASRATLGSPLIPKALWGTCAGAPGSEDGLLGDAGEGMRTGGISPCAESRGLRDGGELSALLRLVRPALRLDNARCRGSMSGSNAAPLRSESEASLGTSSPFFRALRLEDTRFTGRGPVRGSVRGWTPAPTSSDLLTAAAGGMSRFRDGLLPRRASAMVGLPDGVLD
mmetsp:Transcript_6587/g.12420  ORF Transcript_6587/g.12420 Transcript_6587/m.12420 type:complete len:231 (+) Transcript_6587:1516-2208(+)